ncbi:GNAT family N-acetyltransferase [Asanoa siamensis]|nr:GNAT family N-acetyltransferase [Asanoa siamensis]
MTETLIDIVAVPGAERWLAVTPDGAAAGVISLRPEFSLGPDPPLALGPGAPELSLHVAPAWRRRGVGSRLLAAVRERTTGPRLVADVVPGTPGEAFCVRHGFRLTVARRHDLLTYCEVHGAWLGELVDAEHPGYDLTYGSLGGSVLVAANAGDELAAYAVAVVDTLPRAALHGPTVRPGHRGHALGAWVSAALIQRVRQLHPHVDEIATVTAEDDPDLLAQRADLGFHPSRRTRLYELALP